MRNETIAMGTFSHKSKLLVLRRNPNIAGTGGSMIMAHVHALHFLHNYSTSPSPLFMFILMLMLMLMFRRARGARCRGPSPAGTGRRASTSAAPGGSTASLTSTEATPGNKRTVGRRWRTLFSKSSGGRCSTAAYYC